MIKIQTKRRRPRIEIVPMIDVMFFMLVFFLLFSTLKSAQTGVEVELPKAVHLGQTEQGPVIVNIDKDFRILIGQDTLSSGELGDRIGAELRKDPQARFIIKPDSVVPYRELIKVMDIMSGAGVKKPLLGVDRQEIPRTSLEEDKLTHI
jgi:biopolymer transport protein ExbD